MKLEIPRCSIFRIYRFHGKTNHPICSYLPEYLGSREYFSSRLFELANSRTNRIVPLLVVSIRASFHSSFDSARSFPGSESISQGVRSTSQWQRGFSPCYYCSAAMGIPGERKPVAQHVAPRFSARDSTVPGIRACPSAKKKWK